MQPGFEHISKHWWLRAWAILAANKSVVPFLRAPCWKNRERKKKHDWKIWKELSVATSLGDPGNAVEMNTLQSSLEKPSERMGYHGKGAWLNTVAYFEQLWTNGGAHLLLHLQTVRHDLSSGLIEMCVSKWKIGPPFQCYFFVFMVSSCYQVSCQTSPTSLSEEYSKN